MSDNTHYAWEHYKEVLHEGLKELLASNLSVDVSITSEPYTDDTFNVRVTIEYDGEEITSMSDTIRVGGNCGC